MFLLAYVASVLKGRHLWVGGHFPEIPARSSSNPAAAAAADLISTGHVGTGLKPMLLLPWERDEPCC